MFADCVQSESFGGFERISCIHFHVAVPRQCLPRRDLCPPAEDRCREKRRWWFRHDGGPLERFQVVVKCSPPENVREDVRMKTGLFARRLPDTGEWVKDCSGGLKLAGCTRNRMIEEIVGDQPHHLRETAPVVAQIEDDGVGRVQVRSITASSNLAASRQGSAKRVQLSRNRCCRDAVPVSRIRNSAAALAALDLFDRVLGNLLDVGSSPGLRNDPPAHGSARTDDRPKHGS